MCGRYVLAGVNELSERFQLRQIPIPLAPTFNAAPSQALPVVVEDEEGERRLRAMRWGLVPRWRRPDGKAAIAPINARAETLTEKPMFRGLLRSRRCIVPANGFYEWAPVDGRKQPHFVSLRDGELFGFAGLYDEAPLADGADADEKAGGENDAPASFTIVTSAANELVRPLHDRMAVILDRDAEAEWLSRDIDDPVQLERLLRPYPAARMRVYPVSTAVNTPRNNTPELIEPLAGEDGAQSALRTR